MAGLVPAEDETVAVSADNYTQINPERVKSRAIRQLKDLGFDVTLALTETA